MTQTLAAGWVPCEGGETVSGMSARVFRVMAHKWPETPHWEYDARYLGSDAHGEWLGVSQGTHIARPGASLNAHCDQVILAPHEGWWVARFFADERVVNAYVDIATPPDWDEATVSYFDLDLDVLRGPSGRVWVEDEDEFAQRRGGYPDRVVTNALHALDEVQRGLSGRTGAFSEQASMRWLRALADL